MTSDESFRVVVVGVGHLGRHHARILSRMSGVDLVAVVDTQSSVRESVAREAGTRAVSDVSGLPSDLDGVVVAVPTEAHARVALPFLQTGIAVLVEKPMSTSIAEADAMLDAAVSSGATLAVGHTERYNPAVTTALPLVSEPRFIEVHRLSTFAARSLDIDVVFDVMIHDLDVLLALVDSEPVSIEAVGVPVLTSRVDIANARIRFESGCIANLTASRISRDRVRKLRIFQPQAYVSIDCADQQVEEWHVIHGPAGEPVIEGGSVEVATAEPLERELADFVRASVSRNRPLVSGQDGRRALALAQRIAEVMR